MTELLCCHGRRRHRCCTALNWFLRSAFRWEGFICSLTSLRRGFLLPFHHSESEVRTLVLFSFCFIFTAETRIEDVGVFFHAVETRGLDVGACSVAMETRDLPARLMRWRTELFSRDCDGVLSSLFITGSVRRLITVGSQLVSYCGCHSAANDLSCIIWSSIRPATGVGFI